MVRRFSRQELYQLVWSEPMKDLAVRFGISDVALKKTCARAVIPTPDRGYWAKREAGKSTSQQSFSERPPGMDDEVVIGGGGNYWYQQWSKEELLAPLPPPLVFDEPIEAVRERIAKVIGKVSVRREVHDWHPALNRLLKEDDKRRERQLVSPYPMSWDAPRFDGPLDRRRFRILNALFFAVARMNGKPVIGTRDLSNLHVTFFQQNVGIRLDRVKIRRASPDAKPNDSNDSKLSFSILESCYGSDKERFSWQDDDSGRLEARIAEIARELVLTAEVQYRASALRHHQWLVERKAKLEEEERKRKVEAERAERERRRQLEQGRIDRLLKDAIAFQQADAIRKYVEAIRLAQECKGASTAEEFEQWSKWALAQADRIDPAIAGAFLKSMRDERDGESIKKPTDNLSV